MFVLRLEDDMGNGPWSSGRGDAFVNCDVNHHYTNKCPNVFDDVEGLCSRQCNYFCATQTPELFNQWFPYPLRQAAEKAGYKAVIYKIHKNGVKFGQRQCVFNKKKAKIFAQFNPTDFKNIEAVMTPSS